MSGSMRGYAAWAVGSVAMAMFTLLASPSLAEHPNHARGFRSESTFATGRLDNINLFNGNLTVTIPIGGSFPVGPGLSYGLTLTYTGNVWEWEETTDPNHGGAVYLASVPRNRSNAGLGWALNLGRMLPPNDPANTVPGPVYESPDQSIHEVGYTHLHPGDNGAGTGIGFSRDSTYLRSRSDGGQLEDPDGTVRTFGTYGPTRIEDQFGNGLSITYLNVQTVNGESTPLKWQIEDDHGRQQTVEFVVLANRAVVSKVTLTKFPGASSNTYDFSYSAQYVARACNQPIYCGSTNEYCGSTASIFLPLLTEVKRPDGSTYSMPVGNYILGETAACPNVRRMLNGQLQQIRLPTGGYLHWDWDVWAFPPNSERLAGVAGATYGAQNPFRWSAGVSRRCELAASNSATQGCWTYSQTLGQAPDQPRYVDSQTTVIDPASDMTVHYFNVYIDDQDIQTGEPAGWVDGEYGLPFTRRTSDGMGHFLSSEVYDGSDVGGTKLRSSYLLYDYDSDSLFGSPHAFNTRVKQQRTVYEDDLVSGSPRSAVVESSDFDGLGHYRTRVESGTFPRANDRTTTTTYNPGSSTTNIPGPNDPWILGTFTQETVTEGTDTTTREYCFDQSTGFLKRTRALEGPSRGGQDVIVERRQTASGATSDGFVRYERIFGGSNASLSTGALCSLVLPATPAYERRQTYSCGALATSAWSGASFFTTNQQIDCGTGLVQKSWDSAFLATTFQYDAMGRLTSSTPALGEASTVYIYSPFSAPATFAKVAVRRKAPNGDVLSGEQTTVDGFGRVKDEQRDLPGQVTAERATTWTDRGEIYTREEWHAKGAAVPGVTTSTQYDPFGRAGKITLPDGHEVTIGYTGNSRRDTTVSVGTSIGAGGAIGTTDAKTIEYFDRFGRLTEVLEALNPGNRPVTRYDYDSQGNLVTVTQNATATPVQTRSFAYDGRGFLYQETHPELDTTIVYSQHDALGNPGRVQRGDWDLRYSYDSVGRLVQINEPGAQCGASPTMGCWKEWTYSTGNNQAGSYSNGKLLSVRRHNWVVYPPSRSTGDPAQFYWIDPWVTESYTYNGVGGSISGVQTVVGTGDPAGSGDPATDNTRPVFNTSVQRTPLGEIETLGYPNCSQRFCTEATYGRTVTQAFDNGFMTGIADFAPTIQYHPNGMVSKVQNGNGVDWVQERDASGMARPSRIYTSGASQDLNLGAFEYDGAGNIVRTGSDRYSYDVLSRVADAELGGFSQGCTDSLTLSSASEGGSVTYEACSSIDVGPAYTILDSGSVTLRSEGPIVFHDGFSVQGGGTLSAGSGVPVNPSPPSAVNRTQSYAYDRFGNLTSMTTDGLLQTLSTSGTNNRLSSSLFQYDLSGNLVQQPVGSTVWSYDYDPFNMLRHVMKPDGTGYVYVYGPGDERIWAVDWTGGADFGSWEETYTLRGLDGLPLRQYHVSGGNSTGNWSLFRDYVWQGNTLLAAVAPPGGTGDAVYFHTDQLGSPRMLTDAAGATLSTHVYFPYGQEATVPTSDKILQFTGHERDDYASGDLVDLDYMHARYFSAHLGRFLSMDPSRTSWDTERPQSWNRYSYVLGNPVRFTDPKGTDVAGLLYYTCFLQGYCSNDYTTVTGELNPAHPYDPLTGVAGLGELVSGRFGGLIDSGISSSRAYYQRRFEMQAGQGHDVAAFIDYVGLELVLPKDKTDLALSLAVIIIPEGKFGEFLDRRAGDLIKATLKRSKSYRSELEDLTYGEILRLSKGKGPVANAADKMKKLIESSVRLSGKTHGKPF